MEIDIRPLLNHNVDEINISKTYQIPNTYYENTDIIDLKEVNVVGKIVLEQEIPQIKCMIQGEMILEDTISLEEISYPYEIKYEDEIEKNCKKNENTLDIFMFLWENIVLEVPLRFTKVKDLSEYRGDGWRLISEEEFAIQNNPFAELLKNKKEE